MKKLLVLSLLAASLFFVSAPPAYAQVGEEWGDCVVNGVATLRCIPVLFNNLVSAALMFVGVVAIIMIIYGGIKFINSGGDQKATTEARKILTFAVLGVILVLGSFAIIYFIGFLTGSSDCITNLDNIKDGGCK
jgi:hypothetical protein